MVNAKKYGAGAKEAYLEERVVQQNPLTVSSAVKIQEGVSFWSWWGLYL
jgi:hypothetical protein